MVDRSSSLALVLAAISVPIASAFASDWIQFDDQTALRLVADPGVGAADEQEKDYAWGDLDQDGDIDLVCVRKQPWLGTGGRRNVLFLNRGEIDGVWQGLRYEQARIPAFPVAPRFNAVAAGDVTGDGLADLFFSDSDTGGAPPGGV